MEKICKYYLMNDWIGYPVCIFGQWAKQCSCCGDMKKCTNERVTYMEDKK